MLTRPEGRRPRHVVRRISKLPRPSAFTARQRIWSAGLSGSLALLLLVVLGAAPAQAAAGQVTEFPLTQGANEVLPASGMTLGSDGDLYFGSAIENTTGGAISRITPSGQLTTFTVPNVGAVGTTALGPDQNVWFAGGGNSAPGELGSITPAGQITTFSIPSFDGQPHVVIEGIAAGSDGNMWFTANAGTSRGFKASVFGQVNPATGAVTEFPIPSSSGATLPGTPVLGSDGNIWAPLGDSNDVARVTAH